MHVLDIESIEPIDRATGIDQLNVQTPADIFVIILRSKILVNAHLNAELASLRKLPIQNCQQSNPMERQQKRKTHTQKNPSLIQWVITATAL